MAVVVPKQFRGFLWRAKRMRYAIITTLGVLICAGIVEGTMKLPQSDRPLEERFANPPADSRILKIVHHMPDDPAAQDQLISSLIEQGFGGMACNVSFDGYVENEQKWQSYVRAVKKANDAGMALWLYDEKGYPSGTAGGITLRNHPEWEARGLLVKDAVTEGEVTLDLPPGKPISAMAYPVIDGNLQLDKAVTLDVSGSTLSFRSPGGRWHVMAITEDALYEGTHSAISLADKAHYINLLMPEPTARFLEVTHGAYEKHLGSDLGKYFTATFTDEPSLMSLFFNQMPYRVIPWSPNLPIEFKKRRGYDIEPLIPALVADAVEKGRKARYDFWLTVGELTAENFFGQIQQWGRKHDIPSGGHLLLEEPSITHVPLYGDFFRCIRMLDAPSIDCLTSLPAEVPWFVARLLSSAGELEGRTEYVMSETSDHVQRYRPAGDTRPVRVVTEDEIRGTLNKLALNGINVQTSYYSFAGLSKEQLVRLNEWIGRCHTMLRGGHQVADIAVLYPCESIWPEFTVASKWATDSPEANLIADTYGKVSAHLWAAKRDFTYIDSRAIIESKVRDGALEHGKLRWKVVILPAADTLPMKAWEKLADLIKSGGTVISVGAPPKNSESEFPSAKVQALGKEMFKSGGKGIYLPKEKLDTLAATLDSIIKPEVRPSDPKSPLHWTHRRIDDHDIFFIVNDSGDPWTGTVSLSEGKGELWDPSTGRTSELSSGKDMNLSLSSYGAVLLRF